MGRVGLVFALMLGGCQFVVPGFSIPPPVSDAGPTSYDFAAEDFASVDLAVGDAPIDLAAPRDLAVVACGGSGEPCCAKGPACAANDNLACNDKVCTECSKAGVACCPGTGMHGVPFCVDNHFCSFGGTCM
jgi:hypothetical protein